MEKPRRRKRTASAGEDPRAGIDALREDLERLVAALHDDRIGGAGGAKGSTDDIGELVRLVLSDAKGSAEAAEESLAEKVREKPLLSVGIAAGLGFVLALLLTARGR
jgi:ElaB/YqjD/DUF883 family membrane-anchored ribosome-binding protein